MTNIKKKQNFYSLWMVKKNNKHRDDKYIKIVL